ncbi:outer membrane beta-barrel protein [Pontibacter indicus]|uniref:Outer membrane protein beta-barrel domain-containing protein n=1 Tax=Pontibacter indicus TaxID=1317125 RepID=A0A1R3W9I0_9BACT|nr:outer membrane beta-barrel protein [Pontibacter indicus]SIT74441.1 Outer membrane protein beta-barrel domain-containing protein [Pontibacter indicus]
MKKIFTTAMLALLCAGAYAQTSQGTISVKGAVNFKNENRKVTDSEYGELHSSRSVNLRPTVGYFLKDGLELGVGLGYDRSTSKYKWDDGENYTRFNDISLIPYVRKYVAITEQLQLHGTGYVSFGLGKQTSKNSPESSPDVTSTSTDLGIGIYPGLTYFATPKLGITATFGSLSYSRRKHKPKEDAYRTYSTTYDTFSANLSPSSVSIGIGYFIAR